MLVILQYNKNDLYSKHNKYEYKFIMMMHIYNRDDFLKQIIKITNSNGDIININSLELNESFEFILNNQKISRRCDKRVEYKCPNCLKINIIRLTLFANKLKRGYKGCKHCFNISSLHHYELPDEAKNEYFKKYLSIEEYSRIQHTILTFQHGKYDVTQFKYIPIVYYQNKFQPMMYHEENDIYEEFRNICTRCETCQGKFMIQYLHLLKNCHTINCNNCKRIKSIEFGVLQNTKGDSVLYKNRLEYKFITLCNKYGVCVINNNGIYCIPELNHEFIIRHKKYRNMELSRCIYSDEFVQQIHIIKRKMQK